MHYGLPKGRHGDAGGQSHENLGTLNLDAWILKTHCQGWDRFFAQLGQAGDGTINVFRRLASKASDKAIRFRIV
jgi:hypothetical protein